MCYQHLGLVIIPRIVILSIYPPPYTLAYRNICFSFSFLVKDKNSYFPVVITYILSGKKKQRGGPLEIFQGQILSSDWSKYNACDKLLGSDWLRFKVTGRPEENCEMNKQNLKTYIMF